MTFSTPNTGSDISFECNGSADLPCTTPSPSSARSQTRVAARSRHGGGVQVAMFDGSIGFVVDGIGLTTWQRLSLPTDGQQVDSPF